MLDERSSSNETKSRAILMRGHRPNKVPTMHTSRFQIRTSLLLPEEHKSSPEAYLNRRAGSKDYRHGRTRLVVRIAPATRDKSVEHE